CEVHSDRWIPGTRSRAAELTGPGRSGERLWLHNCCGPVESGNHSSGDVLRNQTERNCEVSGME
ncbi:hypothetical protein M9458_013939, partial [Cirrhinus mrigala]